jgi:hypothetical protein
VDDINQAQSELEELQNDLLGFLGESIGALASFEPKPKLVEVTELILRTKSDPKEEWLDRLKEQSQVICTEIKQNNPNDIEIQLDYEYLKSMPSKDPLQIIAWCLIWLGRDNVKSSFIADLCIIFSKILKVLADKALEIQDLDNKLVWNTVTKECEPFMNQFKYFKNRELIFEFIKKICHLIGRTFE